MTFWQLFYDINKGGLSTFGWAVILIVVLVIAVVIAGSIIWWMVKKFVMPELREVFDTIKDHGTRIRNIEETIRAHEKSQAELEKNLVRQAKSSEEMVRASERITANMELNCMKYLEIVELQEKSIRDLNERLKDLHKEHQIRHAGEKLVAVKESKPKSK